MSAIVGIWNLDGRPVERRDIDRMASILAHRGPDGEGVWSDGQVGLGHLMLQTTPESLHEQLPLISETQKLVITADARLDNREELARLLGIDEGQARVMSDSEFILKAYEQWGEDCPSKLLGDFVFAIWDGRRQELFCGRDHFGVKPLYYFSSSETFAFATEIKALLCLPQVTCRLNEVWVGDYLTSSFGDPVITPYQDILRLPPRNSLRVSRLGIRLHPYWSLDWSRELRLGSDEEYALAFRELFVEAVRCRLRSVAPSGALLSGGLDSSSIVCTARQMLAPTGGCQLHTFSTIYDSLPECDERGFQNAVLAQGGLLHHSLHADSLSPFADLDRTVWHMESPIRAPGIYETWALCSTVHDQGVRVLLSGEGGDEAVSHGFGRLNELAQSGRWLDLAVETRGAVKVNGNPFGLTFARFAFRELDGLIRKNRSGRRGYRYWDFLQQRIASLLYGDAGKVADPPIINPEFARQIGLAERCQISGEVDTGTDRSERARHYRTLAHGRLPYLLEILDKAAAAFSVEVRYPFYDRRLVEFCLALPSEQKLKGGWSRVILRRAMAGLLPPAIQWRADKNNFYPAHVHGLLTFERNRTDDLITRNAEVIEKYVDLSILRQIYDRLISGGMKAASADYRAVWNITALAFWLQRSAIAA